MNETGLANRGQPPRECSHLLYCEYKDYWLEMFSKTELNCVRSVLMELLISFVKFNECIKDFERTALPKFKQAHLSKTAGLICYD